MDINVTRVEPDVSQVSLVGKLDPHAAQTMGERFRAETAGREGSVVVDLTGLTFITSLGIGLIIDCAAAVQRRGDTMVLVPPGGHVDDVLRKTGVYVIVPMAVTVDKALALARASGG